MRWKPRAPQRHRLEQLHPRPPPIRRGATIACAREIGLDARDAPHDLDAAARQPLSDLTTLVATRHPRSRAWLAGVQSSGGPARRRGGSHFAFLARGVLLVHRARLDTAVPGSRWS